jgi:hypothetical protein
MLTIKINTEIRNKIIDKNRKKKDINGIIRERQAIPCLKDKWQGDKQ